VRAVSGKVPSENTHTGPIGEGSRIPYRKRLNHI
jgi:hypothetical protein